MRIVSVRISQLGIDQFARKACESSRKSVRISVIRAMYVHLIQAVTFLALVRYGIMTAPYLIFADGQCRPILYLNAAHSQPDNLLHVTDQESGNQRRWPSENEKLRTLLVREISESLLIERAKDYDAQALTELYQRYAEPVFRYVYYRVGVREVAEDLVADVFVRAIEGLPAYQDSGSPFKAWLYRIAHARVVDYYRRQEVRHTMPLDEQIAASAKAGPDEVAVDRDEARRIWAVLPQLTSEQQLVISMRFIAGFSTAEVAEVLEKTEGAIRAMQHRALASLRRLLETEP
jgi:RNA polymerase sigma-70 factor (ECF subfamily)